MNMDPRIEPLPAFAVMGTLTRVNYAENPSFQALWDAFMVRHEIVAGLCTEEVYLGVSYTTGQDGVVDYVAGMPVEPDVELVVVDPSNDSVPSVVVTDVPAAQWAIIAFESQEMHESIEHLLHTWLPASRYELDTDVPVTDFLRFGDGPVQFHVPVRPKDAP